MLISIDFLPPCSCSKHIYLLIHLSVLFNQSPQTDLSMNFTYSVYSMRGKIYQILFEDILFNCMFLRFMRKSNCERVARNEKRTEKLRAPTTRPTNCRGKCMRLEFIHEYCKMHDTYFQHTQHSNDEKKDGNSIVIEIFIVLL